MGDPRGPWQDYGHDNDPEGSRPRHLAPWSRRPGQAARRSTGDAGRDGHVEHAHTDRHADETYGGTGAPGQAHDAHDETYGGTGHPHAHDTHDTHDTHDAHDAHDTYDAYDAYDETYGDSYAHDTYGDGYTHDTYGDGYDHGPVADRHSEAVAGRWSPRALGAEVAWRYRSAPLWARVTADIAAATLVLALIVGASLALRRDGTPPPAAADRAATRAALVTTTTAPPSTTVATAAPKDRPTTTTSTTAPTTTTTAEAPTTTSPPTSRPSTTTTGPTTSTTETVSFRNCSEAQAAGALPLREGDPGYGPHLDRDGDGRACEWNDRWR